MTTSSRAGADSALDSLLAPLRRRVGRFELAVFGGAWLVSMLVHLYMFTHKFLNHDDLDGLYSGCEFGLSSGRWLLQPVTRLIGGFSSSWLHALFGTLFFALSMVLTVRLLRLRHPLLILLFVTCCAAFPTVASTYAYMFCSAQYLLAMLLATAAACCIHGGRAWGIALGGVCLALSMGCYQAYFPLAAALLVLALLLDALEERYAGYRPFFFAGLKCVLGLALGLALYLVILRVCLAVTGTELVSYQGIGSMGQVTPAALARRFVKALSAFTDTFRSNGGIYHRVFPALAAASYLLSTAALAVVAAQRGMLRRPRACLPALTALVLLPLASNLVYVMTEPETVHQVMIFPQVLPLLLPCLLADRIRRPSAPRARRAAAALTAALVLSQSALAYEFVYVTNRAYFCMDVTYENAYAFMNRLAAKLELQEGYTRDTPVALIGGAYMGGYIPSPGMTGVITGNDALNMYSRAWLFPYLLGADFRFAGPQREGELKQTEEFRAMPCYPDSGSIRWIDGVLVVKLSD